MQPALASDPPFAPMTDGPALPPVRMPKTRIVAHLYGRKAAKPRFARNPAIIHLASLPISRPTPAVEAWTNALIIPPPLIAQSSPAPSSLTAIQQSVGSRFSLYAYSYWRWPSGTAPLATAGQYGGSQSGLIAAYRIWTDARLDTQLRIALTPQSGGEREIALGLRWQPLQAWPLHLVAERRFRRQAPDRFAIAIAGGTRPLRLPAGFRLDSYGQAGWASGPGGSWFFDASAQAAKPVLRDRKSSLSLGVGAWAGGQRDAQRLDIGPRLDLDLSPSRIPLRLSADWRFRIAGNARPESGPAITLSASF